MIDSLAAARSIHFIATVAASGAVIFLVAVADPILQRARGRIGSRSAALRGQWIWLAWIALLVAVASGAAWLLLLAAEIYGTSIIEACLDGGAWSLLVDTRFGLLWSTRLLLALALAVSLAITVARASAAAVVLAIVRFALATALLVSLAFVGHAGTTPGIAGDFHLVSDGLHLLAAGVWVGSLPPLVLLLVHAERGRTAGWRPVVVQIVRRFSLLAIASVAVLLASGIYNTWALIDGPRDLIGTTYGRLVLIKACLFIAMVGIAAVNRFYLTPRLATRRAMRSLGRNSLGEIALAVCAMAFVGVLGTLTPPSEAHVAPPPHKTAEDAAFVHIHSPEGMADVAITPGRPGTARVTIRLMKEDFSPLPASGITFNFADPDSVQAMTTREAAQISEFDWSIDDLQITRPGIWNLEVIVKFENGKELLLDGPIVIER